MRLERLRVWLRERKLQTFVQQVCKHVSAKKPGCLVQLLKALQGLAGETPEKLFPV
jgi:phage tail protein X